MLSWLSKSKRLEIYFSMLYLQNLKFSLKCHSIHPGIHKDPSIGARLRVAYDTLIAAMVVVGIVS